MLMMLLFAKHSQDLVAKASSNGFSKSTSFNKVETNMSVCNKTDAMFCIRKE